MFSKSHVTHHHSWLLFISFRIYSYLMQTSSSRLYKDSLRPHIFNPISQTPYPYAFCLLLLLFFFFGTVFHNGWHSGAHTTPRNVRAANTIYTAETSSSSSLFSVFITQHRIEHPQESQEKYIHTVWHRRRTRLVRFFRACKLCHPQNVGNWICFFSLAFRVWKSCD